MIKDDHKNLKT